MPLVDGNHVVQNLIHRVVPIDIVNHLIHHSLHLGELFSLLASGISLFRISVAIDFACFREFSTMSCWRSRTWSATNDFSSFKARRSLDDVCCAHAEETARSNTKTTVNNNLIKSPCRCLVHPL